LCHAKGILVFLECRRVFLLPNYFAVRAVNGRDDFLRVAPAMNEHASARNNRRRIAFSDFHAPSRVKPRRPRGGRVCRGHHSVAGWSTPLNPVLRGEDRPTRSRATATLSFCKNCRKSERKML